ncbi:MAG TPA: hypothetical protein EYP29_02150, partial [Thermoplasmata archaeon]|nr:hypothetical protein [Thermoplasmata archaeon]
YLKGFKCQLGNNTLSELKEIDLRSLATVDSSEKSYLSFYINFAKIKMDDILSDRYVKKRFQVLLKLLSPQLKHKFEESMYELVKLLRNTTIRKKMKKELVEGMVFFVDMEHGNCFIFFLPRGVNNLMVVDSSPYIKPLANLLEEWEDSLIIFMDENHAAIYHVSFTEMVTEKRFKKDIFHSHKKGGWSQMRFQRIRDGALKHFYKEVAEEVEKLLAREKINRIFIAGPGDAKKHLFSYLSKFVKEKVVSYLETEGEMDGKTLWEMSLVPFFEKEEREEKEFVEALSSQILKEGLAVYGIDEVIKATREGKAELILLATGKRLPGFKCEECDVLERTVSICPLCSKRMGGVDLMEEVVELAQLMKTNVEFIKKSELLESLGGIAAFLRY